jgi:hypothetical protein
LEATVPVNVTAWPFSFNIIVIESPFRLPERAPELAQRASVRAREADIVDPFCATVPTPENWVPNFEEVAVNVQFPAMLGVVDGVVAGVAALPPPPHASIPASSTNMISGKAVLGRSSFWRMAANRMDKNSTIAAATAPVLPSAFLPPGWFDPGIVLADVVLTVTVRGTPAVGEVEDVNTMELGLKLQVAPVGNPEHARLTVPVYPFTA